MRDAIRWSDAMLKLRWIGLALVLTVTLSGPTFLPLGRIPSEQPSDQESEPTPDRESGPTPGWELTSSDVGPFACGTPVVELRPSGPLSSDHDGQVIEGLDISGPVRIRHHDVTVRNSRIRASGANTYGISYKPPGGEELGGATIECVQLDGQGSDAVGILLTGTGQVVRKTHITGYRVGAHWGGNDHWINNLIERLHYFPGSHNTSGSIRGQDIELVGNRFEDGNSSAIALYPDSHPNVVIRHVTLAKNFWQTPKANYCVNFGIGGDGPYAQQSSHVRVVNNMWGQEHHDTCGSSGPYMAWAPNRQGNEWRNNVYENGDFVD